MPHKRPADEKAGPCAASPAAPALPHINLPTEPSFLFRRGEPASAATFVSAIHGSVTPAEFAPTADRRPRADVGCSDNPASLALSAMRSANNSRHRIAAIVSQRPGRDHAYLFARMPRPRQIRVGGKHESIAAHPVRKNAGRRLSRALQQAHCGSTRAPHSTPAPRAEVFRPGTPRRA